jgi:3-oxoacyl-[acyl-carrier-protein] synthase II
MSLAKGGMLPVDCNDNPETASCPFSNQRAGGILSEGAGILVLESLEHALERDAPIYAEVLGHGNWIHPNQREDGSALISAMQTAIENSGVNMINIDYINAHAPSDPILDRVESDSIKSVFSERAYDIPISSIKAVTGNPFACGGSLQTIATSLAMRHGLLPPTANYTLSDPYCDLDYIPNISRRADITYAMVNSRGIGGGNSSLILRNFLK